VDEAVDRLLAAAPRTPSLDDLIATAGELRGEHITVSTSVLPPGRYGYCVKTAAGHAIRVDEGLTGDLRSLTILHELGHILLGHNDGPAMSGPVDRLTSILMGGTGEPARCVAPQSREWAMREADAERFATTMSRRARRGLLNSRASRLDEAFG